MTDLIIGHAHGTHLFCQLGSHIKCSVAKRSQSGRVAVMCYPDPYYSPSYLGLILFSHLLPRTKKKLLELGLAGSTQWGTAPESFYRAERVQIRCNLPSSQQGQLPPTHKHKHTHTPSTIQKHFVFQRLTFSSRLVFFLLNFFFFLVASSQAANQAGSQQMWQALVCRTAGCVSPVKNSASSLVQQNRTYCSH